jgi:hypothetical protein
VDDEIDVIHQNPHSARAAFDILGSGSNLFPQPTFDFIGNGEDLSVGVAVADHEVIGDVADSTEVENDDLLGFLVPGGQDAFRDFGTYRAGQDVSSVR